MWLHSFILQIFSAVLTFVTPIFLPYILEYIRDKNMAMWYGYTYAALVVCASIMSAFFFYHASLVSLCYYQYLYHVYTSKRNLNFRIFLSLIADFLESWPSHSFGPVHLNL